MVELTDVVADGDLHKAFKWLMRDRTSSGSGRAMILPDYAAETRAAAAPIIKHLVTLQRWA